MKNIKIDKLVQAALFTAMLCALSPFSFPIGAVPITLCTLVIYIMSGVVGPYLSVIAVAVYVILGTMGLPVFSGFSGGVAKLFGVTGGYILGYVPLALCSGFFCRRSIKIVPYASGMVIGTFILYLIGTAWFVVRTGSTIPAALAMCVLPFLPGDAVKIFLAASLAPIVRHRVEKLRA